MAAAFRADLTLLTPDEGGRRTPIRSGYRSMMRFGSKSSDPPWGVTITFSQPVRLKPGDEAEVHVATWADDEPVVTPGMTIYVCEGSRIVGTGTIK